MTCKALHWPFCSAPPGQSKAPSLRHGTIHRHRDGFTAHTMVLLSLKLILYRLRGPAREVPVSTMRFPCALGVSPSALMYVGAGSSRLSCTPPLPWRRRTHCAPWRSSSHWVWLLSCDEAEEMVNGARGSKNLDREGFRICIGILIQIVLLSSVALCQAET
ncbi:hypothetical protein GGI35DRAFT_274796 [Trichoderma velutinum]